ncbi:hepatitis A virus cellular receptor 1 isoform X2 [Labrus mixtus]|uniref:hepatitis A virus cellular receptor 1 isoform X2 n=1 Tax=Labrus mixtus TaxID=508554 RepID=UPI0029C0FFC2|nr:hepatitis A virus cellular receptor 1 isoform X2 [Labrus mixtus]
MKTLLLLVLLSTSECSSDLVGRVGQNVTLSCRYNINGNGARSVCWGRGHLPSSGCDDQLISTDGKKVTKEASRRYRLLGRLDEGDVSLTILNLTETDTGRYGCRVDIWGLFNDEKHHFDLTIDTDEQSTTETTQNTETTTGPTHNYTAGQLTSTESAVTSSSAGMKGEQESSNLMLVLVLVLLGLISMATAGGVLYITRRWRRLNKIPPQQVSSTVEFNQTSSTLQLHRRGSAVENIYQLDGGEYEYCP